VPGNERVVLEEVPQIGFYGSLPGPHCPEDFCFEGALRSCLQFLGERYGCSHRPELQPGYRTECGYAYLMTVSGSAFFMNWPGWPGEPHAAFNVLSPVRFVENAFAAVGYDHTIVRRNGEDELQRTVIESIRDHRRPVMGLGVSAGPPEPAIVAGYDEGGDVLIGWSFFQRDPGPEAEFEPSGMFRMRGWYEHTPGLIVIGEKRDEPPLEDVYRTTLRLGVDSLGGGLRAYQAWADDLHNDERFSGADEAELRRLHEVHDQTVGTIAEARHYGNMCLREMAAFRPSVSAQLLEAAACLSAEHDLMWDAWNALGGLQCPTAWQECAKAEKRREMAPIVLRSRDNAARAVELMNGALEEW